MKNTDIKTERSYYTQYNVEGGTWTKHSTLIGGYEIHSTKLQRMVSYKTKHNAWTHTDVRSATLTCV